MTGGWGREGGNHKALPKAIAKHSQKHSRKQSQSIRKHNHKHFHKQTGQPWGKTRTKPGQKRGKAGAKAGQSWSKTSGQKTTRKAEERRRILFRSPTMDLATPTSISRLGPRSLAFPNLRFLVVLPGTTSTPRITISTGTDRKVVTTFFRIDSNGACVLLILSIYVIIM